MSHDDYFGRDRATYSLVAAKRDWVPEWLWSACKPFVLWLWPLQEILTTPVDDSAQ